MAPWSRHLAMACAVVLLARAGGAQGGGQSLQERLGYPAAARLLVIHADDLGMSRSVNRATFEALEKGWISSSSIMVPCPWFADVANFARTHPDADLGIHLTLNSEWTGYRWGPVSASDTVATLLDKDGYLPLEETAVVANARAEQVERELRAQIDRARAAGIRLSHLDSHMATLFRSEALQNAYLRTGAAYDLPLLLERSGTDRSPWTTTARATALVDRVLSLDAPGPPIAEWPAAYERMLEPLPPGVYELIVHLAYDDDEMRGATWDHPNWGAAWRQADFDLVKSQRFRDFLQRQGFIIVSWRDLARRRPAA